MHTHISGLQNDFELLRILNYWSLNYRSSIVLFFLFLHESMLNTQNRCFCGEIRKYQYFLAKKSTLSGAMILPLLLVEAIA